MYFELLSFEKSSKSNKFPLRLFINGPLDYFSSSNSNNAFKDGAICSKPVFGESNVQNIQNGTDYSKVLKL